MDDIRDNEVQFVEYLRADIQYEIGKALKKQRVSRAELARRLGISRARISQLMGEDGNPTLETLARIFYHLGLGVIVVHDGEESLADVQRETAVQAANVVLEAFGLSDSVSVSDVKSD